MKIGIGLPNPIPGTPGATLVEWARRAEARGFSTLATIDRIAYPSYESIVALAAASAGRMRNPCSGFSSASTITAEGERSGSWVSESGASGSTFTSSPSQEREGRASVAGRSVSRTIRPTVRRG